MRAVTCYGPEDYRLETRAVPTPGAGEALVKVEAVGICASDVKCYSGAPLFWGDEYREGYCQPPITPGHEFVGRIVELDDTARRRWGVDVGDRVVSEQIVPCWQCRYCQQGSYWMCQPHDIYGFRRKAPGAMAEYMVFPAEAVVHKISPDLPAAHAAFAEPLACSLNAVERAGIGFEDVVVVAGVGPIGLGMVAGARRKNPRLVVAVDFDPRRLDVARACGADLTINAGEVDAIAEIHKLTDGYGCDVYLDAAGHPKSVVQGLHMLRKMGTFVEYGVFRDPVTVDWTIIGDTKALDIRGAHLGAHCWPAAIRLLESKELPMARIVTHELPLDRFGEGFELVSNGRESIKVVLIP
jgi:threonine dehydrogenase-like Zn-dependent dehydrogenase